jgi:hypothetical protein
MMAGCSLTPPLDPRLVPAAAEQGRAAAGVRLPAYPARCGQATPHARIAVGDSKDGIIKREQAQLDKANADKGWCHLGWYDPLRARLGGGET